MVPLMYRPIRLLFMSFIFLSHSAYAWEVLQSAEPMRDFTRTFSFPIHSHLTASEGLIVTAATQNQSNNYALSIFDFEENVFRPYAHEKVTLNGVEKQENPLFNNGIPLLAMIDQQTMALTLKSDAKRIFLTAFSQCDTVLSSNIIKDAYGQEIDSDIVALAGAEHYIFAAVNGKGQKQFGCNGSAVAVCAIREEKKEIELSPEEYEDLKKKALNQGDEQSIERFTKEITTTKDGKHTRKITEKKLEQIDTAPLSINGAVLEGIDMHWCSHLKRLYIGMKRVGNQDASDGACGILVASVENSKLIMRPFISSALVSNAQNQIAIGKGSNAAVSIHKVRSMLTTTVLDYLIVQGGNGLPDQTRSTVYALPVHNFHGMDGQVPQERMLVHGTIANDTAEPIEAFLTTDRAHLFLDRHFNTPPQTCADVVNQESPQALVGAGPLTAGPIEDIFVRDDAVYAVVNNPSQDFSAGIYYSQAIFGHNGAIAAWTAWQPKIITHDEVIIGMSMLPTKGSLVVASGNNSTSVQTIKRSVWNDAKKGDMKELASLIEQHFPKSCGGIQGMFDHDNYLAILGLGKALLFDMHTNSGMIFADSCVKDLGPLTAGQIIEHAHEKYLILGGLNGVAVADLNASNTSFKLIGDYTFVRKILVDENFVYILTDRSFDRIDLNNSDLTSGKIYRKLLANAREITHAGDYGIFLDCIVSQKCSLIAHSAGLHRVGNGKDIRYDQKETLNWTQVVIPDCNDPVIVLIPISITGKPCDWAKGAAGQMYVISGSIGNNIAKLNRFAIASLSDKPISDTTIVPLRDFVAKNHISHFVNIGNFSPLFATDGTLFFTTGIQRRKKSKFPILVNSFKKGRSAMPLTLDADASINCIMRHTKSGNWMIGGDFGLIVNE